MGKLKDAHVFSNEEGSIAKFFVAMASFAASVLTASILTSLIEKEPFQWEACLLTIAILMAVVTVVYFIARLLAYRTRLFPKTENREGVHGVSFIFLLILSFVLFVILA
jgi:uncharacterized membrane protein